MSTKPSRISFVMTYSSTSEATFETSSALTTPSIDRKISFAYRPFMSMRHTFVFQFADGSRVSEKSTKSKAR